MAEREGQDLLGADRTYLRDLTAVRSACVMLMRGVVWVSFIRMHRTDTPRAHGIRPHAPPLCLAD